MSASSDTPGGTDLRTTLGVLMIGFIFVVLGLWFVWSDHGFPDEVTTTATVTDLTVVADGGRNDPGGDLYQFRFTTGGREVAGSDLVTMFGATDSDGTTVTIVYPPDAPEQADLRVTRGGLEFLPMAFGILLVLGSLRSLVRGLRQRSKARTQGVSDGSDTP